jgi:hypothetical protein
MKFNDEKGKISINEIQHQTNMIFMMKLIAKKDQKMSAIIQLRIFYPLVFFLKN